MLDLFVRQAYHMTLVLKPIPSAAPDVFLEPFLDPILAKIDAGEAVHVTQHGTRAMRARRYHLDYDNKILYLLINFSDTNVSDPAFENLATGDLRVEPKLKGEGVAVSTYMAIDLIPDSDRFPHYKVILEDVPGIGRTKICPFLTYLVRKTDVRVFWRDPEGTERRSRPEFTLEGARSQTFEADLGDGTLSYIDLTRYRSDPGFDEKGVITQEKSILRLKIEKVKREERIPLLNRIKKKALSKGYTDMRVAYSPKKKTTKTADFGTSREDVADVLTIKHSEVRLAKQRSQCETVLRDDVLEKLRELVLSRREESA